METGWLKLHRKFKEWEWYQDSKMVHLFIHLLVTANHQNKIDRISRNSIRIVFA